MSFIFVRLKKHFHIICFALSLALKQRLGETRKWPSHTTVTGWQEFLLPIRFQLYASRLRLFVDLLRYEFSNLVPRVFPLSNMAPYWKARRTWGRGCELSNKFH